MRSSRFRRRALIGLAVLAVAASACSSDRDPTTTASSTTAPGEESFGDLASPCGEGDGAEPIKIGYGDDAGFAALPGGGHEMTDAVEALLDWCNDQGGINGRLIEGTYLDAKLFEVTNAVTQACSTGLFMLVGQGWALDNAQEQARLGCDLPSFPAYSVNPVFSNAPLMVAASPNPVDQQSIGHARWYAAKYPAKAKKVATLAMGFPAALETRDKTKVTWPKVGMEFLGCDQEFSPLGETDWKPLAQKLKDCGAEVVSYIGAPFPAFENFLEAAEQLDYRPDYLLEGNFYDEQLARWNTKGLADRIFVRVSDVPLIFGARNDATADYLRIVEDHGGDVSLLGIHAASAFLLWATAVDQCGTDVTRACVLAKASAIHDWDGGGMSGPADVGRNLPTPCIAVLTLDGTTWKQVHPKAPGELDCDEENVQEVTGPIVERANLGPDRKVHQFDE